MHYDKEYWSIGNVIAQFAEDSDWWNTTRQLTKIEAGLKSREKEAHTALRKGAARDYKDMLCQFIADAIKARAELKDRKRTLGLSDDVGRAWSTKVIGIIKRDFGIDVWNKINQEAREYVDEITKLRSTPMGAGSVVTLSGSGGGVKTRD